MNLALFICLSMVLHSDIGMTQSNNNCCHTKSVGNVEYTLVTVQDTSIYKCNSNCLYKKQEDDSGTQLFCFKRGNLPVQCGDHGGGAGDTAVTDATSTTTTTTTTSTTTTTTTATTTTTTTTVPKGWTKVFSHNTTGGLFNGSMSDALSKNPTSPSSLLFSTLSTLEDSRRPDGSFLLRICYPELQAGEALPCNEWSQTSNPATDAFITDFRAVRLQFPENSYGEDWGGLGVSPASRADTFIDDTPDRSNWCFAVAASSYYPRGNTEGTIPGPKNKNNNNNVETVKKVEMYAFNDHGGGPGDTAVTGMPTVFTQPPGELELTRDKLLTTLPTLGKEWQISFQFKPTNYDNSGYTNLIHLTIGGDRTSPGDRTPAIFFEPNLVMQVSTSIGSNPSHHINNITPPPVGKWSTLTLTQLKSGAKTTFSATINGDALFRPVMNPTPLEFSNVKVYASDPFYQAQQGFMKNLVIKTL